VTFDPVRSHHNTGKWPAKCVRKREREGGREETIGLSVVRDCENERLEFVTI